MTELPNALPKRRFKEFQNTHAWEQRKLGEIVDSFSGGTPSASNRDYYNGSIPFIRSGEINANATELFITEEALNNSSAKLVTEGNILYALYGATSGEVGISQINGAINQAVLAIKPKFGNDSYLITQWLKKQKKIIRSTYLQGGQGNLSGSIVKNLMIDLPTNNEEQTKIGLFFKHLDEIIAFQQRKLEKLKALKSAYLLEMFPAEGESAPKRRFAGFTQAWEQRKFDEEVEFYSGLTYSPKEVNKSGTFVLRSSNVKNGEIVDADNVYVNSEIVNSSNVKEGDIIVVVRNGSRSLIGKHAQIKKAMDKTVIGAFMTGIRSQQSNFINALLDTHAFKAELDKNLGATINQITNGMFREMQFMFPDSEEQKKIGNFFNQLDQLITLHERKVKKLQNLKRAYLHEMIV